MGGPDVSVIIPACAAEATLARAVGSVLGSANLSVEAIIVANDEADYRSVLQLSCEAARSVQFLRTPTPRSGPSSARNLGMERAQAPLLAFLDADDFYAPDRLSRLAPLAREHGAATGPCSPVPDVADAAAILSSHALEDDFGRFLSLETLLSSRRSFSPVMRRGPAPRWRPVGFAEDLIFNLELLQHTSSYAYESAALYGYVQTTQSGSRGPGSLQRALRGYGDILAQLFDLDLSPDMRLALFRQLQRDIADAGSALFDHQAAGWGETLGNSEKAP